MQAYGACKVCEECASPMAVLDILMEGYDLVCSRCGIREVVNRTIQQAPPCFQ